MSGSFRLFSLFGIGVFIHWSWLIIFALFTWSLATGYLPGVYPHWTAEQRWAVGAITTVLFFGSVLAHEISHSLEARRRGLPVSSITLFLFGGVSALGAESKSARDEFWIAIVGPLTSFAFAIICAIVWAAVRGTGAEVVQAIAGYLAYINVAVGVFNLLPGFPLDGGRVLRAILWGIKKNVLEATRIAGNVGRVIAGLLIVLGIISAIFGAFGGLWLVLIGWFLWNAAESSYHQMLMERTFHGLKIAPLIEHDVPRVPPDLTLKELAYDYILRRHQRVFFVAPSEEGDILGIITLYDLRHVPEDQWAATSVYRAMTPRERLIVATPSTDALDALQMMAEHNINQLPVYDGREPVGLLTRAALINAVQLRQSIGAKQ
jgi:Zn-dependent protease/predicted transcriptional regulator